MLAVPITQAEIDRELIRRRGLHEFIRRAWHVVEGDTPFVDGPHIELIATHLEAVSRGKCKRLVINVPPGCSKSTVVSVLWPAWHWAEIDGKSRWMHLSFDIGISLRDAGRCQKLIESDWYQERYGFKAKGLKRKPVALAGSTPDKSRPKAGRRSKDQQALGIFWNNQKGNRFSTMVRGKGLGWHCHIQVCDDPTKPDDIKAGGDTAREALKRTLETWQGTFASRKADPKNFARVVIMQRLHTNDLAATCIAEGYTHLCLPMEYETAYHCRTPFGEDWRVKDGELLCPERYDAESVATTKKELGARVAEAQLQQRPSPDGGTVFRREWFNKRFREIPAGATWWQSWDATFKDKEDSDYVVGQVWARAGARFFLVYQVRARMDFVSTARAILDMIARYPQANRILVEDKANGTAVMNALASKLPGLVPVEPLGSKPARAHASTPFWEAGNVYLPEGAEWVDGFVAEHTSFPVGMHDDQVDAMSQALAHASGEGAYLDDFLEAMGKD